MIVTRSFIRLVMAVLLSILFTDSGSVAFSAPKKYRKVPGGVKTLMEIDNSQKGMEKILKEETRNYKKVKKAIESNSIKIGDTAADISYKYGQPVVKLQNKTEPVEKWIYKPGNTDFFSVEQIWLIFDKEDNLLYIDHPQENEAV